MNHESSFTLSFSFSEAEKEILAETENAKTNTEELATSSQPEQVLEVVFEMEGNNVDAANVADIDGVEEEEKEEDENEDINRNAFRLF